MAMYLFDCQKSSTEPLLAQAGQSDGCTIAPGSKNGILPGLYLNPSLSLPLITNILSFGPSNFKSKNLRQFLIAIS